MSYRALLAAVSVCFIAAGCENKPAEAPKPTTQAKVTPLPPAAPTAPAASAGQDATASTAPQAAMDTKSAAAPLTPKPACKGGNNCNIDVEVAADTCTITKRPPRKHVAKGHAEKLTWTIKTAGWDFDANGVSFSGAGASVFTCKPAGAGKYECDDKNADASPTDYPYAVKVKDKSGKACSNDPMIVNGAPDTNNE